MLTTGTLLLLITAAFVHLANGETSILFINASGIDSDGCGTQSNPCGTIGFASELFLSHEDYKYIESKHMYVSGQNKQSINDGNDANSMCVLFWYYGETEEQHVITISFDTNTIKSMRDWFPDICYTKHYFHSALFTYSRTISVTFNNLIIQNVNESRFVDTMYVTGLIESRGAALTLNNCLFDNIKGSSAFEAYIRTGTLVIHNTTFSNILFDGEPANAYSFLLMDRHDSYDVELSLSMYNCMISNYNAMSFIRLDGSNILNDIRYINIYNSSFTSIATSYSLITSSSFLRNLNVDINISMCQFFNIYQGVIIVTNGAHDISIQNIEISTNQLMKQLVEDAKTISLFSFQINDEINMNNIDLHYIYPLHDNCDESASSDFSYMGLAYHAIMCFEPIQFVQNNGVLHMSNVSVSNDITYDTVTQFLNDLGIECTEECTILNCKLCEFYFYSTVYTTETDYALIENEGDLFVYNMYIQGVGIHIQLFKNLGNAYIDNLMSQYEYYYENNCSSHNNYCGFDRYTLNIPIFFRNDGINDVCGGTLTISNSYIYGVSLIALSLNGGNNYIENTIINYSRLAVIASPDVVYLDINNVEFINIGAFYQNHWAIIRSVELPPPLTIYAQDSIIQNSLFSFFDLWGFIDQSTAQSEWSSLLSMFTHTTQYSITLINNTFDLNTNDTISTLDEFLTIASLIPLLAELGTTPASFAAAFDADYIFFVDGLISFGENSIVNFIENTFYGHSLPSDVPFMFIDNNNINCLSSNILHGFALNLTSGFITSCHRPKLVEIALNQSRDCWSGGLGTLVDTYAGTDVYLNKTAHFITTTHSMDNNLPLIAMHSTQSVFSAEKVSFSTQNNIEYNIMKFMSGTLLLFDAIFDNSVQISYGSNCDILCFQTVNDSINPLNALQLSGNCRNQSSDADVVSYSLLTDSSTLSVAHWSPYFITLIYNKQYYAGGELYLNYSIFDAFNNEISNYDETINISIDSNDLDLHLNLIIDADGECQICEQGIYILTATNADVGKNYTIQTNVVDNELVVNDIELYIIDCPTGYGIFGAAKQCEICDTGYFSLYASSNECIKCEGNTFDIDAISCAGGDNIIINNNYWIQLNQDTNDNVSMVSSFCSPSTCCQDSNGCNYLQSQSSLCAFGRDVNSLMCSQCLDGYTEMIGSVKCGICKRDYIERLVYPFMFALFIAMGILFMTAEKVRNINSEKDEDIDTSRRCRIPNGLFIMINRILFKPILYYFQTISYLTSHKGGLQMSLFIQSVAELFNFSFDITSSQSDGYCFIQNMNSKMKILLNLFIPFLAMFMLFILYLFSLCFHINFTKRKPLYLKAFFTLLILCIGKTMEVIFKVLSCKNVGDNRNVHFYFAYDVCHDIIWWIALITLFVIIVIFVAIFIYLYRSDVGVRQSRNAYFASLTNAYTDKCWYFEFFILFRRTILALLSVISFSNAQNADIVIVSFLLMCILINERLNPFIHHYITIIDSICLSVIIVFIFVTLMDQFSDIVITFLILFPIFVFICCMYFYCKYPNQQLKRFRSNISYNQCSVDGNTPTGKTPTEDRLSDDDRKTEESQQKQSQSDSTSGHVEESGKEKYSNRADVDVRTRKDSRSFSQSQDSMDDIELQAMNSLLNDVMRAETIDSSRTNAMNNDKQNQTEHP